jgi:tRNA-specific 2-thiouridylase
VGGITKPQVREIARRFNLPNAEKKDSQGICFIGQVKMSDFLRHYLPDNPGDIVDLNGRKLGRHDGLHLFTMGQRKGHHVASPREGVAYVVVGKDLKNNRLILGYEGEETPGLYTRRAIVGSISNTLAPLPERVMAQVRYRAAAVPATCTPLGGGRVQLDFDIPVRAVALGQVCAFYEPDALRGEKLLGGGFFEQLG